MTVELRDDNRRMLTRLSIVAMAMFGFGFALVPFYDHICRALGINSMVEKSEAPANTVVDLTRKVTIELDANSHGMPWRFQPTVRHLEVHPGELTQVMFEVRNGSDRAVTGQAIPSFGPQLAGRYFKKLDCFCFTQQTLAPGEVRRMPVAFVVEPALPQDVNTVTLSYTFFEVEGKKGKDS